MNRIRQPEGSDLCGQIAVAVVTEFPLADVIRFAFNGHQGRTNTRRIIFALRLCGFECGDKLERSRRTDVAIARLAYAPQPSWSNKHGGFIERRPRSGHWVVVDEGRIWDGIYGDRHGNYEWPRDAKLTSFLPLLDIHYDRSVR